MHQWFKSAANTIIKKDFRSRKYNLNETCDSDGSCANVSSASQLHIKLVSPCYDSPQKSCLQNIQIHLDTSDGILETSRYIHDQENWVQSNDEYHNLSCYFWDNETKNSVYY